MSYFFSSLLMMFKDPSLSVSLVASMLACISLSLIGVIYYLRKSALIGEVIAHSAFPGLIIAAFFGIYFQAGKDVMAFLFMIGAISTAYLSIKKLNLLQKKFRKSADASLMVSISAFLGVGVLLASIIQSIDPVVYKDLTIFLYGRAATMLRFHLYLYSAACAMLILFLVANFRRIRIFEFDKTFASFLGIGKWLDKAILSITLVIVILSLRTLGILLLSGMMTAPAIAARWWVKKTSSMFVLSAIFGGVSAVAGNYLSLHLGGENIALPTGPMITVTAASIALFSLMFGVRGGAILRAIRRLNFSICCREENILKALYKNDNHMTVSEVRRFLNTGILGFIFVLLRVRKKVTFNKDFSLTLKEAGREAAERIIRLHRLWEVYLYEAGFTKSRIHVFAEEIEHVLTDEMEERLIKKLGNPTHCPHQQKIPKKEEGVNVPS